MGVIRCAVGTSVQFSAVGQTSIAANLTGVCDTKVERREKLKKRRKILAYPYRRPLGQPLRARGRRVAGR